MQFFRLHLSQQQDSTEATTHCWVLAERDLKRYLELLSIQSANRYPGNCCCWGCAAPFHHAPQNDQPATVKEFLWRLQDSEGDRDMSSRGLFLHAFLRRDKATQKPHSGNGIRPAKAAYLPFSTLAYYLLLNTPAAAQQSHYAIRTVTVKTPMWMWCYFFPLHFHISSPAFPFHTSCSRITH